MPREDHQISRDQQQMQHMIGQPSHPFIKDCSSEVVF
jgi:hypothetical protein